VKSPHSATAMIELTTGPMYSGKSSHLLLRLDRLEYIKKPYLVITHSRDIRYGEACVATHNGHQQPALAVGLLADIPKEKLAPVAVIAIDEGQFFTAWWNRRKSGPTRGNLFWFMASPVIIIEKTLQ
jgi:thymidine kinase